MGVCNAALNDGDPKETEEGEGFMKLLGQLGLFICLNKERQKSKDTEDVALTC